MCNCSTWHNELDFECCCTCHGSSDERQNAANNHARRLCTTIARLTAEVATFQAMMLDCEAERDALAADLAALRGTIEQVRELRRRYFEEPDYLTDSAEGYEISLLDDVLAILSPPEGER